MAKKETLDKTSEEKVEVVIENTTETVKEEVTPVVETIEETPVIEEVVKLVVEEPVVIKEEPVKEVKKEVKSEKIDIIGLSVNQVRRKYINTDYKIEIVESDGLKCSIIISHGEIPVKVTTAMGIIKTIV